MKSQRQRYAHHRNERGFGARISKRTKVPTVPCRAPDSRRAIAPSRAALASIYPALPAPRPVMEISLLIHANGGALYLV